MEKNELLSLFKTGSQNYRIVERLLICGKICNFQFADMNVLKYTSRISAIRNRINPYGFDIVAKLEDSKRNVYSYMIKEIN